MSAPACPFCEAADVERIAQWGGQMITSQWRCRACGSYFEAVREELGEGGLPAELGDGDRGERQALE